MKSVVCLFKLVALLSYTAEDTKLRLQTPEPQRANGRPGGGGRSTNGKPQTLFEMQTGRILANDRRAGAGAWLSSL